jgi:mRNA-degrading endonuclease RelE of RelBE toxin-antitoxin system
MPDGVRYLLQWDPRAETELDQLRAFDARPLLGAVERLRDQAEVMTRNRKPLRKRLFEVPAAGWEVRVGQHRVLYRVQERTVTILRVILKGRRTMSAALGQKDG